MDKELCKKCDSVLSFAHDRCPACGYDVGAPNVRNALRDKEVLALESRYMKAFQRAKEHKYNDNLEAFEKAVNSASAVINTNLDTVKSIILDEELYTTYHDRVRGHVRLPANSIDDRRRRAVDSILFGAYGESIVFGALSLDGKGLYTYGPITLKLKEIAIKDRATLLNENSYVFVRTPEDTLYDPEKLPLGYIAVWDTRGKLAVSKLGGKIEKCSSSDEYAKILLYCEGDRKTDDFIEVHIYGACNYGAFSEVAGNSKKMNRNDKEYLTVLKGHLAKKGLTWIEV